MADKELISPWLLVGGALVLVYLFNIGRIRDTINGFIGSLGTGEIGFGYDNPCTKNISYEEIQRRCGRYEAQRGLPQTLWPNPQTGKCECGDVAL